MKLIFNKISLTLIILCFSIVSNGQGLRGDVDEGSFCLLENGAIFVAGQEIFTKGKSNPSYCSHGKVIETDPAPAIGLAWDEDEDTTTPNNPNAPTGRSWGGTDYSVPFQKSCILPNSQNWIENGTKILVKAEDDCLRFTCSEGSIARTSLVGDADCKKYFLAKKNGNLEGIKSCEEPLEWETVSHKKPACRGIKKICIASAECTTNGGRKDIKPLICEQVDGQCPSAKDCLDQDSFETNPSPGNNTDRSKNPKPSISIRSEVES